MNAEIKQRWVAALRDPNAKQGRHRLGDTNGKRCCLGVLCDLAVADGIIEPPVTYDNNDELLYYNGEALVLPVSVLRWAGLPDCEHNVYICASDREARLVGLDENTTLTALNDAIGEDDASCTFPQIADVINYFL